MISIYCQQKNKLRMDHSESFQNFFPKDIASEKFANGCYLKSPEDLGLSYSKAMVPLRHIDYELEVINGLLHARLSQSYQNPTDKFLAVQYSFPIDPNSSVYEFVAQFKNVKIEGVVKERQLARKEYEEAKREGKQVALAQLHEEAVDIMNLEIGNVPPHTEFSVRVSFLQEMEISQNTFFRLQVPSTISPRYVQKFFQPKKQQDAIINPIIKNQKMYTWSFKVALKTTHKVIFWKSTTHELKQISQNEKANEIVLVMPEECSPSRDFIFLYTTENFELPGYVIGKSDTSTTVMLSFIPKFCQSSIDDAFSAYQQNKKMQTDFNSARGEYIFLIDRSGSMSGSRIKKARQALAIFLKSLPIDSYFNVVSFGSSYSMMYEKGQRYGEEVVRQAIRNVKKMGANYGGTQLYNPIAYLLQGQVIEGYPKHIFVLTDGQVYDVKEIFSIIQSKTKYTRVHGIGIGSGASRQLIKGVADSGKGKHIMISDSQDPTDKIIELLDETMTPLISNVKLEFDRSWVESIVPNPDKIPYILKNDIANFYITFNRPLDHPQMFKFQYEDSTNKLPYTSEILVNPEQSNSFPVVDKMAHFRVLRSLEKCARDKQIQLNEEMFFAKVINYKMEAVKYSVKHQVLSQFTSFLCIGKELVDGKYQEYLDKGKDEVVVPQTQRKDEVADKKPYQHPSEQKVIKSQAKKVQVEAEEQCDMCMGGLFGCGGGGCGGCGGCGGGCGGGATYDYESDPSIEQQTNLDEITSANVLEIIEKQSVIGYWSQMDLIDKIGKDKELLMKLCQQIDSLVVLTQLVIRWIEKFHAEKKYLLILRKSKDWLKQILKEKDIPAEMLSEIDCIQGELIIFAKTKTNKRQFRQQSGEEDLDMGDLFG